MESEAEKLRVRIDQIEQETKSLCAKMQALVGSYCSVLNENSKLKVEIENLNDKRDRANSLNKKSVVYFVQFGNSGPIKIGSTSTLKSRLAQLGSSTAQQIVLLGYLQGSVREEKSLHRRFQHLLLYGELFSPSEEILSFIGSETLSEKELKLIQNAEAPAAC